MIRGWAAHGGGAWGRPIKKFSEGRLKNSWGGLLSIVTLYRYMVSNPPAIVNSGWGRRIDRQVKLLMIL